MPDLHVIHGDITRLDVDAIVNAANTGLREGSGVCGAIFRAAGAADLQTACDRIGYCATGDAVATPGFALPARWVIHTVGPVWHGGSRDEAGLLASCYRRVLEVAADIGARSVAFPAISTGVFGYPAEQAADIAVATVQEARSEIEAVHLVAFDRETERLYRERLEVGGP